jgi:hypothetical protein
MASTYEWSNDTADDERNNVCPSWQGNVALQHDDEAENKADHKKDHVPPPWRFFVVFNHVHMMAVVEHAFARTFVRRVNILTHEEDDMHYECADLELLSELAVGTRVNPTYGSVSH